MVAFILVTVIPTLVVWLILFLQSHQLFCAFRDRYPEEAQNKIRYAFEFRRHPSKFFYFMSAASAKFLEEKKDRELLGKRRLIIRFSIASLVLAIGNMAIMMGFIALIVLK